ncbi:MAG: DoxX family membrane protein [Candidatus Rokuibacteriota bacterium]
MKAYGITLLRVTVGAIFLLHALRLVRSGGGASVPLVGGVAGLQDPSVGLWLVLGIQGLGGLLLLAGLFTRPAAAANALLSGLGLVRDVGRVPLGSLEFPALLLAATLALLALGSGPVALRPSR